MSQKEKNSIKDITEDDEETNLFRAEMMNFYKNKTEEELLNEKYRLENKKCMKMKNNDPMYYTNTISTFSSLLISVTAAIFTFNSLSVALSKDISEDMRFNSYLLVCIIIINIPTWIRLARSYGSKMDKLCKCKQCKIALMCIDDILNERQFQTVECNDKVKRYYIEVRDRK
ncbi:hypothetical protein DXA10_11105 [Firmicutes bacterium AM55-24TS]|nr:hypothetical protein DXA10_11105 [Firmicutes bacterium AM55-24TS]